MARNDVAVRAKEELPLETTILAGEVPESVTVRMNALTLRADLMHGQKTGIFLDQRDNYRAAARYARGGKALDCFTSTGGFALHLAGKCESVEAADSSGPALVTARANAAANGIANIDFKEADIFQLLTNYASARRHFSMVVLDPPAFAKSRRNLESATTGYKEINLRALRLLQPGGILVTCSCSHHLGRERPAGTGGTGQPGRQSHAARIGAPHAESGSPDPADGTRDALPEVPDPGSGLDRRDLRRPAGRAYPGIAGTQSRRSRRAKACWPGRRAHTRYSSPPPALRSFRCRRRTG